MYLTQKASSTNKVIDDVIIWKWRHQHDYLWPKMASTNLMWPHNDSLLARKSRKFLLFRKNFFSKFSKFENFQIALIFFCGDLRCLICFLKDAETFKLSVDKVSGWRHVEAGLISSLFSEKYDFWSKFMVFQKIFFA